MARHGLGQALIGAMRRAVSEKTEVVRENVRVKTNGGYSFVDLTVTYLNEPDAIQGLLLVTLRPASAAPRAAKIKAGRKQGRPLHVVRRN